MGGVDVVVGCLVGGGGVCVCVCVCGVCVYLSMLHLHLEHDGSKPIWPFVPLSQLLRPSHLDDISMSTWWSSEFPHRKDRS